MSGRMTTVRASARRAVGAVGATVLVGAAAVAIAPWAGADGIEDIVDQIAFDAAEHAGSAAAVAPDLQAPDLAGLNLDAGGLDTGSLGDSSLHDPIPGAAATTTPDIASVPLSVQAGTEPVINASIGGGPSVPVLVDSGANGLIIPWQDFGWQNITGLPTNMSFGAFSGGMTYFYVTVPTTVSFGDGIVATDAPVNVVLASWATNPTSITDILFPPTISSFLAGAADGIFGVGPNAFGPDAPGSGVMDHLPGDLGQGVLIDQPQGTLTFGSAQNLTAAGLLPSDGMVVDGSPRADLMVSFNGGDPTPVSAIIDSGGVFGSMPNNVTGLPLDANGAIPAGTNIAVYTKDGDLLYSYNTGSTYAPALAPQIGEAPSPTAVSPSSLMNTGNYPFTQGPVFIGSNGSGGSQTIFGWLPLTDTSPGGNGTTPAS